MSKTMTLKEMAKKLIYQNEVNTGYTEGFMGRIEHDPIKSYSTQPQTMYQSGVTGLNLNWEDWEDSDELIEKSFNFVFRDVSLMYDGHETITDDIKKEFMVRFWDMRLGFPTQHQFLMKLRYYFRTDVSNLLIQNYLLSQIKPDDLMDGGKSASNTNATNHQGQSTRPDNEILKYELDKDILMLRANQYAKTYTTGESGAMSTYGKYNAFLNAERFNNKEMILNGARKLFLLTMNV